MKKINLKLKYKFYNSIFSLVKFEINNNNSCFNE